MLRELRVLSDHRGKLGVVQGCADIPFTISRIFYIFDCPESESRGFHAHRVTDQFLIAVSGSCRLVLDDGLARKEFELNENTYGVYQKALIWGEMDQFSEDCVLLVLASHPYDESDYIRDYGEFLECSIEK